MLHVLRLRLVLLLLVGVTALLTPVMALQEDADVSRIPQRPVGHIHDAARWLDPAEKEFMGAELARLLNENQIDVFLVTRSKLPPQGPETYARILGEAWSKAPVWCVVFQVPGDPAGFHVEAGGVETDRSKIELALKDAIRRARKENSEKDRFMAAWQECSQGLRFVHQSGKRFNERFVDAKKKYISEHHDRRFRTKVMIVAVVAGLFVLMGIVAVTIFVIRKRRFTFEFPETSWRKRFRAPHSGGSGIVVNYRGKRLKQTKGSLPE